MRSRSTVDSSGMRSRSTVVRLGIDQGIKHQHSKGISTRQSSRLMEAHLHHIYTHYTYTTIIPSRGSTGGGNLTVIAITQHQSSRSSVITYFTCTTLGLEQAHKNTNTCHTDSDDTRAQMPTYVSEAIFSCFLLTGRFSYFRELRGCSN